MMSSLSIRTTLLTIIGILNILILALVGNGTFVAWQNYRQAQALKTGSAVVNALYEASRNLSQARAASAALLYSDLESATALRRTQLQNRKDADEALTNALNRIHPGDPGIVFKIRVEGRVHDLIRTRQSFDSELAKPPSQRNFTVVPLIFNANTDLISEIQNLILVYVRSYQEVDATINRQLLFKNFVWEVSEFAGQQYALMGRLIAEDVRPNRAQLDQLISLRMRVEYGWDILHKFSMNDEIADKLLPYVEEAQTHYFMTFDQVKDLFYEGPANGQAHAGYPISIDMWLGMASQAVDSLLALQSEVIKETQRHVDAIEHTLLNSILISAIIFFCTIILSLYCASIIVFRIARPVNQIVNALFRATQKEIYEVPKISRHNDEIGKLVHVLEVFQKNANKIKRSNEELERFAFLAAHDLKSPLRAIDNLTQWLEEDLDKSLDKDSRKHMVELRHRVKLMDKLLDDTLEYARIDSKMAEDGGEIVSGKALIDEIIGLLNLPEGFSVKASERLTRIRLHRMPIHQVLFNLITNAVKHHDKEQGTIIVDAEESDTGFVFSVRDDGPGIPPQYHQKIFEMFQTLKPKNKDSGRGMGLAFVRKIVTGNGGSITVNSDTGKGTEFRFTWPKGAAAA